MDTAYQVAKDASEQHMLWNGPAGRAWVDAQALLDHMFKPFEDMLAEAVQPGDRVLDIGCGTGATTLAITRRAKAECIGVDISAPMLALAGQRAEREGLPARFICADAQEYAFAPGGFDRVVSRFGVMFFDDPMRAFANLRQAARAGAALDCIAWRSPAENPFMTTAERAAAPVLPDMPARRPGAPGQFAFADAGRVEDILDRSSWSEIAMRPIDIECRFPASALATYFTRLGPLGLVLQQADESTRGGIVAMVRAAFDPFVHGDEVRFTAACWSIRANAC